MENKKFNSKFIFGIGDYKTAGVCAQEGIMSDLSKRQAPPKIQNQDRKKRND